MAQPVATRSQRRIERKQLGLIAALIVAVAGISFAVGVMYGQKGGALPDFADDHSKPRLPMVTQIAPPPQPVPVAVPNEAERLTFYDNLPKGSQAPLGSGINLPPEAVTPVDVQLQTAVANNPAALPSQPLPQPTVALPADPAGAYVVQIASFRTDEDANKLAQRLKKYKLTTFTERADLGEKGVWHRVLAGPFASRQTADQAAGLLKEKERLSSLVRQR